MSSHKGRPLFAFQALVEDVTLPKGRGSKATSTARVRELTLFLTDVIDPDNVCVEARRESPKIKCRLLRSDFYICAGEYLEGTAFLCPAQNGAKKSASRVYELCFEACDDQGNAVLPPRAIVKQSEWTVTRFLKSHLDAVEAAYYMTYLRKKALELDSLRDERRRESALPLPERRDMSGGRDVFLAMCFDAAQLVDACSINSSRAYFIVEAVGKGTSLSRKRVGEILKEWNRNVIKRLFYTLGLKDTDILKCRRRANVDMVDLVEILYDNPYRLLALSLERAMQIADTLRLDVPETDIVTAKVARGIAEMAERDNASCVLKTESVVNRLGPKLLIQSRDRLEYFGITFDTDKNAFYETPILYAERYVAERIAKYSNRPGPFHGTELGAQIEDAVNTGYFETCDSALIQALKPLDEEQRGALFLMLRKRLMILNGPAGTGKTTIIKSLVILLENSGIPYVLCAFTGKAVSNMMKKVGRPAFTIHSLIFKYKAEIPTLKGLNPGEGVYPVVIVDEYSMVTTPLISQLLRHFGKMAGLALVGDVQQLPPIGPGAFARELIASRLVPESGGVDKYEHLLKALRVRNGDGVVPVHLLSKNHRASTDDAVASVLANVQALNSGKRFDFITSPSFRVVNVAEFGMSDHLAALEEELKKYKQAGGELDDLGIVTPYNNVAAQVNELVREIFFPETLLEPSADKPFNVNESLVCGQWYIGARVMQCSNNYEFDVMNGEEGTIVDFAKDEEGHPLIIVEFEDVTCQRRKTPRQRSVGDGYVPGFITRARRKGCRTRYIAYSDNASNVRVAGDDGVALDVNEDVLKTVTEEKKKNEPKIYTQSLSFSFCTTIHKYQGSEREHIFAFFPRHAQNDLMITRELVNVAITRCRRSVCVIGDISSVTAKSTTSARIGLSMLAERIRDEMGKYQN